MNSYWITSPFTPGAMQHYVDRHDAHEAAQAHADRFECPVHIYATPTTDGERVATVRPTP